MANNLTLTSFAENIFRARDQVAREPQGFLGAVTVNSDSDGVSINGTVNSLRTSAPTLNTSYTPSMTVPSGDSQTIANDTMTIGQVANVQIPLLGEEVKKLQNVGAYQQIIDDMFAQAFRVISNQIEAHVGTVAYKGASRAIGTAGTTPFASTINVVNSLRQVLKDNGAPTDDLGLSLVIDTLAGTNLRNLTNLYKANESGTTDTLRKGALLNLSNFAVRESAGIATTTAGTGASYVTSGSTAIGVADIALVTGTGTVLAGDVVTFAADSVNKYVVGTGVAAPGTISLNRPGAKKVIATANALTVGAAYTANIGFHKSAIELVVRPPSMPVGGDLAVDRMTVSDPVSGLVFEVALYLGYGKNLIDITTFYQAKVWKPEFVATLMG